MSGARRGGAWFPGLALASLFAPGCGDPGGAPDLGPPAHYPAAHPSLPQVVDVGGARLTAPRITAITFAGDPIADPIERAVGAIAASSYFREVTAEYGIGTATAAAPVRVAETAPAMITGAAIESWLSRQLDGTHPEFGVPDERSLYVLFYPAETRIASGSQQSCRDFGGYHNSIRLRGNRRVAYAVVARCRDYLPDPLDAATFTFSHELAEAATDPYPNDDPAWSTVDDDHVAWGGIFGAAEIGDLCVWDGEAAWRLPDGPYVVQRIWSNRAAQAGLDPCVPPLSGEVFFDSVPVLPDRILVPVESALLDTLGLAIAAGASKTIDVALFSTGPVSPWEVGARAATAGSSGLGFAWSRSGGQNGDVVKLTITVGTPDPSGWERFLIESRRGGLSHVWPVVVSSR